MQLSNGLLRIVTLLTLTLFHSVAYAQLSDTCSNPTVRREWRQLSDAEKQSFHQANLCLRGLPKQHYPDQDEVVNRLDDLTWTHFIAGNERQIHYVAHFLPWHRLFVDEHEKMLRSECGYQGTYPYWDWSIDADANNVANSPIWDPATGFGGNGHAVSGAPEGFRRCVLDGPYTNLTFTIGSPPESRDDENMPHCLNRDFTNFQRDPATGEAVVGDMNRNAYTSRVVASVSRANDYSNFAPMLETGPHDAVHNSVNGEMAAYNAPNDIMFYMHHANVDRIWAQWQEANAARLSDYGGFRDQSRTQQASIDDELPVYGLFDSPPLVRDYMNTRGGALCYVYN
ncbi:hypothetical protein PQX77_004107 [Marasmius sp. AFHP31]|nr:hypothetical protein PQX77_004107 [Marasmius sp. AFHP31]